MGRWKSFTLRLLGAWACMGATCAHAAVPLSVVIPSGVQKLAARLEARPAATLSPSERALLEAVRALQKTTSSSDTSAPTRLETIRLADGTQAQRLDQDLIHLDNQSDATSYRVRTDRGWAVPAVPGEWGALKIASDSGVHDRRSARDVQLRLIGLAHQALPEPSPKSGAKSARALSTFAHTESPVPAQAERQVAAANAELTLALATSATPTASINATSATGAISPSISVDPNPTPPSSIAGSSVRASAPCGGPGLRPCAAYFYQETFKGSGVAGFVAQLQSRIQLQQKGFYDGKDIAFESLPDGTTRDVSRPFGPTVCSVVPTSITGQQKEIVSNHKGASCGDPFLLSIRLSGTKVLTDVTMNATYGTREAGYIRGSLVAGLDCFEKSVENEIITSRQLVVQSTDGAPSACLSFAKDYVLATQTFNAAYGQATGRLTSQANIDDIANCDATFLSGGASGSGDATGSLRQSAQQLCAARASIEAAYTQLTVCEVFSRTAAAYRARLVSVAKQRALLNAVLGTVFQDCYAQCKSGVTASNFASRVPPCANTCYQQKMPAYFEDVLSRVWGTPANGCTMNGTLGGLDNVTQELETLESQIQNLAPQLLTCAVPGDCRAGGVGLPCTSASSSAGETFADYLVYSKLNPTLSAQLEDMIGTHRGLLAAEDALLGRQSTCTGETPPQLRCRIDANSGTGSNGQPVGRCEGTAP